jgi:hypothetical protein
VEKADFLINPPYFWIQVAVLLLELTHGGFRSETATWIQKGFKISAGTSRKFYL